MNRSLDQAAVGLSSLEADRAELERLTAAIDEVEDTLMTPDIVDIILMIDVLRLVATHQPRAQRFDLRLTEKGMALYHVIGTDDEPTHDKPYRETHTWRSALARMCFARRLMTDDSPINADEPYVVISIGAHCAQILQAAVLYALRYTYEEVIAFINGPKYELSQFIAALEMWMVALPNGTPFSEILALAQ